MDFEEIRLLTYRTKVKARLCKVRGRRQNYKSRSERLFERKDGTSPTNME